MSRATTVNPAATLLEHPRPVAQRDLVLRPALHRRPVKKQRDQVVADGGAFCWIRISRLGHRPSGQWCGGGSAISAILPHWMLGQGLYLPLCPAAPAEKQSRQARRPDRAVGSFTGQRPLGSGPDRGRFFRSQEG